MMRTGLAAGGDGGIGQLKQLQPRRGHVTPVANYCTVQLMYTRSKEIGDDGDAVILGGSLFPVQAGEGK